MMRAISSTALLLIFTICVLPGCRPTLGVLHNVNQAFQLSRDLSSEEVREAIHRGLASKSWRVQSDDPGQITANISVSGHQATIQITYSASTYSIAHVSSSPGLKYEDEGDREVIHRRYNHWINLLDQAIYRELSQAAATPAS